MIQVFTLSQADTWDRTVQSFKNYDVYWLSGYVKAFWIHGDGEPLLLYYDDGLTRGINAVMKRDIAKDKRFAGKIREGQYYDFATPYGYGGWIIEGYETANLFEAYENWIQNNGIISEFVRFHPVLMNHTLCEPFYNIAKLGSVVHIPLLSSEDIWNNLSSKNRNMIRKAIKNGITIYNGRFPEIYEKFRFIYNSTMDRDDATDYYYFEPEFYSSVLTDLPLNAQVFWAEKDKEVIAASIIIGANGHLNYHLSGSLYEYRSLAPTNLLLYQAALWGWTNGYKELYLGGGVGSGEDDLFRFKRAFYKGELRQFYIGKRIFDNNTYDLLQKTNTFIKNKEFFPVYRG